MTLNTITLSITLNHILTQSALRKKELDDSFLRKCKKKTKKNKSYKRQLAAVPKEYCYSHKRLYRHCFNYLKRSALPLYHSENKVTFDDDDAAL